MSVVDPKVTVQGFVKATEPGAEKMELVSVVEKVDTERKIVQQMKTILKM